MAMASSAVMVDMELLILRTQHHPPPPPPPLSPMYYSLMMMKALTMYSLTCPLWPLLEGLSDYTSFVIGDNCLYASLLVYLYATTPGQNHNFMQDRFCHYKQNQLCVRHISVSMMMALRLLRETWHTQQQGRTGLWNLPGLPRVMVRQWWILPGVCPVKVDLQFTGPTSKVPRHPWRSLWSCQDQDV